jgi:ribosomal protein L32
MTVILSEAKKSQNRQDIKLAGLHYAETIYKVKKSPKNGETKRPAPALNRHRSFLLSLLPSLKQVKPSTISTA